MADVDRSQKHSPLQVSPVSQGDFTVQDLTFMRMLQRDVNQYIEGRADAAIAEAKQGLLKEKRKEGSDLGKNYAALKSKEASARKEAKRNIISAVTNAEISKREDVLTEVDYLVLGVEADASSDDNSYNPHAATFHGYWETIRAELRKDVKTPSASISTSSYGDTESGSGSGDAASDKQPLMGLSNKSLLPPMDVTHHVEVIENIKRELKVQYKADTNKYSNQQEKIKAYEEKYIQAIRSYYKLLKQAQIDNGVKFDQDNDEYLSTEAKRAEFELKDKKNLSWWQNFGFRGTRFFALGIGSFAMAWVTTGMGLGMGFAALALAPFAIAFWYYGSKSNWLTANKELGPLMKDMFNNPAESDMTNWQKLKSRWAHYRYSSKETFGRSIPSIISGVLFGLIVFGGLVAMFSLFPETVATMFGAQEMSAVLPGWATVNLGVLGIEGSVFLGSVILAGVLAPFTVLVYFMLPQIFSALNDKKNDNQFKQQMAIDAELNNVPNARANHKWSYRQVAFGMLCTLVFTVPTVAPVFDSMFARMGANVMLIELAAGLSFSLPAIGLALVVALIGFKAIMNFYKLRTQGASLKGLNSKMGTGMSDIAALKDPLATDLTGRNVPDFRAVDKPTDSALFPFEPTAAEVERARRANAVAQAGPSFGGGMAGFGMIAFMFGAGPVGILVAGIIGGAIGAYTAFKSSYNANSQGPRKVSQRVPDLAFVQAEVATYNKCEHDYSADNEKIALGNIRTVRTLEMQRYHGEDTSAAEACVDAYQSRYRLVRFSGPSAVKREVSVNDDPSRRASYVTLT